MGAQLEDANEGAPVGLFSPGLLSAIYGPYWSEPGFGAWLITPWLIIYIYIYIHIYI